MSVAPPKTPASVAPVQTRSERFASVNHADFPEVTRHMMISWECYLAVQGQVLRHN